MTSLGGINNTGTTFRSLTQSGGVAESLPSAEPGLTVATTPSLSRANSIAINSLRSSVTTLNRSDLKDQTRVSSTARAVSQALQTPDVRHEKVAALQEAIASGSYQVSSGEVADKILTVLQR